MRTPLHGDHLATRLTTTVAVLLAPLAAARAQQPTQAPAPAVSRAFLTAESVVALSLRPRQVLTNPAMAVLPVEVAQAAGEKFMGMDPANVLRAIVVGEPPLGMQPFYAVFLQADRDWDLTQLAPEVTAHTRPGQINGRDCLLSVEPMMPCFMVLKGKTLVAASEGMLKKFLDPERPQAEGTLYNVVANHPPGDDLYLAIDLEKLRPLIQLGLMSAQQQVEPEFQKFLKLPSLMRSAELTFNPDGSRPSRLSVNANNMDDAAELEQLLTEGVEIAKARIRAESEAGLARLRESEDPIERSMAAYADRLSGSYLDAIIPKRAGVQFTLLDSGDLGVGQMNQMAVIGMLVALLLPAVQAARAAARRAQSTNNLRQLLLGLLNYESSMASLPPHAIYSDDGRPLLSWRVAILPYLEHAELYNEFHLDEPWDSPHNRSLIPRMPQLYLDPSSSLLPTDGKSTYTAVTGLKHFTDRFPQGRKLTEITDGMSNTIALVEVSDDTAPIWTKPDDWSPAPGAPFASLGGRHPGGFLVGFCDGSVRFVADGMDVATWLALLTINGGEVINPNGF